MIKWVVPRIKQHSSQRWDRVLFLFYGKGEIMIEKEKLKQYANKLMFDMDDNEYQTLQEEFEIILKQMDLISKIKDIDSVEPMTFPFVKDTDLREDVIEENDVLTVSEVLENAKQVAKDQVKVPKVVE